MKKFSIGLLLILSSLTIFGMCGPKKSKKKGHVETVKFPGNIFDAVKAGDIRSVAYYIGAGQVNYKVVSGDSYTSYNLTPLGVAITEGDISIIELLLYAGAKVNEESIESADERQELYPLTWAVKTWWTQDRSRAQKIIDLLLEREPGQESLNQALRLAAALGRVSPVNLLLDKGARPSSYCHGRLCPDRGRTIADSENRRITEFNSLSCAKNDDVRSVLFSNVVSRMKKGSDENELADKLSEIFFRDSAPRFSLDDRSDLFLDPKAVELREREALFEDQEFHKRK